MMILPQLLGHSPVINEPFISRHGVNQKHEDSFPVIRKVSEAGMEAFTILSPSLVGKYFYSALMVFYTLEPEK